MRISVVSNLYPPVIQGGAEISTRILVEALRDLGHDVQVLTLMPPDNGWLLPKCADSVLRLRTSHPYFPNAGESRGLVQKFFWHTTEIVSEGPAREAAEAINMFGTDLILTQNLTGLGLGFVRGICRRLQGVPVIHTLRDYGLMCVRNTRYHRGRNDCHRSPMCIVKAENSKRLSSSFTGVVGVSGSILGIHRDAGLFTSTPAAVIYNSIDAKKHRWQPPQRGMGGAIGYIGQLSEEKGVFDLLRAYRVAKRQNPGLGDLLFAGSGRGRVAGALMAESQGLPVHFLGYTRPEDFFERIGVLVVPSRWDEPFGRVVIEGADAGLSLIVSNRGGLQEAVRLVDPQMDSGSVTCFEGGNVPELARALVHQASMPPSSPPNIDRAGKQVATEYLAFAGQL